MINKKLLVSSTKKIIEPAIIIADSSRRLITFDINKNKYYQTFVGDSSTEITYVTYLNGIWYACGYNSSGGIVFRSEDALHWVQNNTCGSQINDIVLNPLDDNDEYQYIYYGGTDNGYDDNSEIFFGSCNLPKFNSSFVIKNDNAIPFTNTYDSKNNNFVYGCITYSLNSDPDKIDCVYFIKGSNAVVNRYILDLDDSYVVSSDAEYRCTIAIPEYVESEDKFYMAVKVINWNNPNIFGAGGGNEYLMVFESPSAQLNRWTKIIDRNYNITIFSKKFKSIIYNKLINKSIIFSKPYRIYLSNKKLGDGLLKFDDLVKLPSIGDAASPNFVVPYKDGFIRFSNGGLPRILIGDMIAWETLETSISFNNIKYVCSNEEYFI